MSICQHKNDLWFVPTVNHSNREYAQFYGTIYALQCQCETEIREQDNALLPLKRATWTIKMNWLISPWRSVDVIDILNCEHIHLIVTATRVGTFVVVRFKILKKLELSLVCAHTNRWHHMPSLSAHMHNAAYPFEWPNWMRVSHFVCSFFVS